jgi:FkbM family methyltransferase
LNTRTKIRLARAASFALRSGRALVGRRDTTICRRGGLRWELDLREGIDLSIFLFGAFEPEVVASAREFISPGGTVLDIGANIGAHTLKFAELVGEAGVVYAFEPTDYAFAKLSRNVALNPGIGARVRARQVVLVASDVHDKPDAIWSSWPLTTSRELHDVHLGELKPLDHAQASTLDDQVHREGLSRIDVIKLDVDGNELFVLQGGRHVLAAMHPPILMEFAPYLYPEFGYGLTDLSDFVRSLGYSCRLLPSREPVDFGRLAELAGGRSGINALLVAE